MTARVTSLKGAAAGAYYVVEVGSYYLSAEEPKGRWFGDAATALGLSTTSAENEASNEAWASAAEPLPLTSTSAPARHTDKNRRRRKATPTATGQQPPGQSLSVARCDGQFGRAARHRALDKGRTVRVLRRLRTDYRAALSSAHQRQIEGTQATGSKRYANGDFV